MPKTPRTRGEVQEIRDHILDEAVYLITEKGFNNLSMRAIAARMDMTAANIYNYYKNKDELYLDIQTRGFAQLHEYLQQALDDHPDPHAGIPAVMRAYLTFGISFPSLYEIMFILNTPKYADYKNTSLEPVACIEKATALKAAELMVAAINGLSSAVSLVGPEDAFFRMTQVWTALHGIVSLYNSRVLQEVEADTEAFIDRCIKTYSRFFVRDPEPEKGDV
jgi:AcrR family transcriptional regulator